MLTRTKNNNPRAAQEIAGHTDPAVTAGYTRGHRAMLSEALDAYDAAEDDGSA